jgi:hypothetical protein
MPSVSTEAIRYLSEENVPGTNVIYEGMKQFFVAGQTSGQTETLHPLQIIISKNKHFF